MLINGAVGFITMVTVLYCIGGFANLNRVLYTKTGFPFHPDLRRQRSQYCWGHSHDRSCTPPYLGLRHGNHDNSISHGLVIRARQRPPSFKVPFRHLPLSLLLCPVRACLVVTAIAAALTLIYIGSYTAFNDVISLTITGFYGSYFLPAALLLYHRIKGNVLPHGTESEPEPGDGNTVSEADLKALAESTSPGTDSDKEKKATDSPPGYADIDRGTVGVAQPRLIWGPWHLPGIIGTINNAYACCYMIFVIFWKCLARRLQAHGV